MSVERLKSANLLSDFECQNEIKMTKRPSISGDENHNAPYSTREAIFNALLSVSTAQSSYKLDKTDHHHDTRTMIVCRYFHFCPLLLLTLASITMSSLEFEFPICSESHVKAKYTLQDPAPCKEYTPHSTKQK